MRIAFVLFDDLTALDFVGVYDPLTRLKTMGFLPDLAWDLCAPTATVEDEAGLRLLATRVGGSLEGYDLVVVPGGPGTRTLRYDPSFLAWLRTASSCPLKASVCTGSLLMGAAGFLDGRTATTHPAAFDLLREWPVQTVVDERIVDEGAVITARGVTSSIDLGLYLCEKLAGAEAGERIRRQIDYRRPSETSA